MFHDPFVLGGYPRRGSRQAGVLHRRADRAQRQTALVAKQAACLDVLSGRRFRLGIGVGWNEVEFTALNENFHNRGRRSEEQAQVMQALWAQPHVTFKGKYHTIDDAGINPRPASGRSSALVWRASRAHPAAHRQMGRWLDAQRLSAGSNRTRHIRPASPPDRSSRPRSGLRRHRGLDILRPRHRGRLAQEAAFWKQAGVSHLCLTTTFNRRHHHRIAGKTVGDHLAAMKRYRDAIGDLL